MRSSWTRRRRHCSARSPPASRSGAGCSSSRTARADDGFAPPEDVDVADRAAGAARAAAAQLLVVQLTEDAPLPAHVAAAIAARSDGSPLFVTEMVRAMRDGADHDTLPESVEG